MREHVVSSMLLMALHLILCHLFVGSYHLSVRREDDLGIKHDKEDTTHTAEPTKRADRGEERAVDDFERRTLIVED